MHATRIALLLALVIAPAVVSAGEPIPVFINCQDAVGIPGGTANVEVTLVPGDALVVGTENDLGFDGAFGIRRGDCFINPAIGPGTEANKELQQNILTDPPRVRGIVVSLDSFAVIPEGLLYTCPFGVPADMPEGNYPVTNGTSSPVTRRACSFPSAPATARSSSRPRHQLRRRRRAAARTRIVRTARCASTASASRRRRHRLRPAAATTTTAPTARSASTITA